uniref:Uncharacterized protein n=1 Tax=Eutreptiella gymnastica TaxID=73025 RepID=A0A7S1I7J2_9EUGL
MENRTMNGCAGFLGASVITGGIDVLWPAQPHLVSVQPCLLHASPEPVSSIFPTPYRPQSLDKPMCFVVPQLPQVMPRWEVAVPSSPHCFGDLEHMKVKTQ